MASLYDSPEHRPPNWRRRIILASSAAAPIVIGFGWSIFTGQSPQEATHSGIVTEVYAFSVVSTAIMIRGAIFILKGFL